MNATPITFVPEGMVPIVCSCGAVLMAEAIDYDDTSPAAREVFDWVLVHTGEGHDITPEGIPANDPKEPHPR